MPLLLYSHRCVLLCRAMWLGCAEVVYTYPAWGFALLVSTDRAMRRPQNVKRATVQGFTLFLCLIASV